MKILFLVLFFTTILFAENAKIYLYTPEINVNNFKSLKTNFDTYLNGYGEYELQPFNDKDTFEKYLKKRNAIAILSSWHYREIAEKYNLKPILVAKRNGHTTDRKILVGMKNTVLSGVVTSAYAKEYTNELLNEMNKESSKSLSILKVPKEIDALMSVGFGMSKFALVSKDTFEQLQLINPKLSKELKIYYESAPEYRMLLACNEIDQEENKLISILKNMEQSENGKNLLHMIGIDKLVVFNPDNGGESK